MSSRLRTQAPWLDMASDADWPGRPLVSAVAGIVAVAARQASATGDLDALRAAVSDALAEAGPADQPARNSEAAAQ